MTLFVGGPRHGQDVDVQPQRRSVAEIGTDLPLSLPSSYVDVATASMYYLRQFTFVTAHPLTGQPDQTYTHEVYVLENLGPEEATQALHLAVLGQWFVTEGTRQPEQPAVPS